MKHKFSPGIRGFSLIEVAIVLVIIAIIAGLLTPLVSSLIYVQRSTSAYDELGRVYTAIVGNPSQGFYGYLGDVGDYPTSLMDLVQTPGFTGWAGPYLTDARVDSGVMYDSFGSPMEYYLFTSNGPLVDDLAIISPGPDRSSTNSGGNVWGSFSGVIPTTSNSNYGSASANLDNIVFPRFTDTLGLLKYQNVGTVNLNVLSYDYNSVVSAYVPACPNLFEFKATSVARTGDTFGTTTTGTAPPYNSGGASVDLVQGLYRLQLRTQTLPNSVVWDSQIAVNPNSTQSITLNVPGVDSSTTGTYSFIVTNANLGFPITVYSFATSIGASIASGAGAQTLTGFRGCSQVTVRNSTTNAVVDSFVFPIGLASYTKIYNTSTFTFTLTNTGATYRNLFVYQNNLLIGEVSKWGSLKTKIFSNIKQNDVVTVKDETGTQVYTTGAFPGSNQSKSL